MTELQQGLMLNGRYVLKKEIGGGSFGRVWVADDTLMGMEVALKVFMAFDPKSLESFKEEYRITFDLHHDNLLAGMSCDVWEQRPFIVMEYCPEGSTGHLAGKVDEDIVWRFIRDVASGLAYLHGHQPEPIIHRDIKPDNILIRRSGSFAITDFGLSKKTRATMLRMSGRESQSGSVAYMGPELFRSSGLPVMASDIWALGVTVYELVTGELPFCGMGGGMLNVNAEIPDLPEGFSDELNNVVQQMMTRETWDRPTAVQLEQWAERALRGEPVFEDATVSDSGGSGGSSDGVKTKSRKGVWIGIFVAVAVLIVAVLFFTGPDKQKILKECELLEQRADAINSEENGYREAHDSYKKILELVRDNNLDYNTREVIRKEAEIEKKIEEKVKDYEGFIIDMEKIGEEDFVYESIIKALENIYQLRNEDKVRERLDAYKEKLNRLKNR